MGKGRPFPKTHGQTNSRAWKTWVSMRERCRVSTHKDYPRYGGRGIRVCERWQSFENFLADMGPPPHSTTLDRINNDGNYEPQNCRWATSTEQNRNSSQNVNVRIGDRTECLRAWCAELGLNYSSVWWRIKRGWEPARALQTPTREYRSCR